MMKKSLILFVLLFVSNLACATVRCPTTADLAQVEVQGLDFNSAGEWFAYSYRTSISDYQGTSHMWRFVIFSDSIKHGHSIALTTAKTLLSKASPRKTYAELNKYDTYQCNYDLPDGVIYGYIER